MITALISLIIILLGGNVYQGVTNRKLRKQIEILMATISRLQSDIEELKKEMKALKFWNFRKMGQLYIKIRKHKKEITRLRVEIYNLRKNAS